MTATSKPRALITGASRGLGAAIARTLHPDYELLLGARTPAALAPVLAELPTATGWPVELTDYSAVAAATAGIERLDVLIHNAGVADLDTIADSTVDQWRKTLEANLIAVAELTRLLLPALRTANGHVVLVNSGAGQRANPGWASYAASKFGLRAFADALRQEEPTLRVTSIYPGRTATDMQRAVHAHESRPYDPTKYLQPETVARAIHQALTTPPDAHPTEITLRPR
ncbi:SDR family oxidoreductase [Nocardia panacis]|uniref:SDR family oxidoreductase n=1 Tax=Nocardia panacis TaxID=2340916 RepID=A0A3A4KQJ3_9NOCA|nr:SDR family oxidoreductase [Nocardia panacis]RJO76852.1 SDR family oxidoreductase [Nocardia panacis]